MLVTAIFLGSSTALGDGLFGQSPGLDTPTTTSASRSLAYDAPSISRIVALVIGTGNLATAGARDTSIADDPVPFDGISTSTTPARGFVATNTVRLRPGTTQAGIERTYEAALNPQSYIDDVVRQRGINLRGSGQQIEAVYNPNLASAGMSRAATPNVIEVGPLAMSSSDELARTLLHELNHARSWLKGGVAPESTAYAAEDALSAGLRWSFRGTTDLKRRS
jgi:hypothetical protein